MSDLIHKASHYNKGKYEVIDVIRDWNLNFCLGNTLKYIARAEHKGNALQDIKKAREYILMEIEYRKKQNWFKKFIRKIINRTRYYTRKITRVYNPLDVVEDWKLEGNLIPTLHNLYLVGLNDNPLSTLELMEFALRREIEKRENEECTK